MRNKVLTIIGVVIGVLVLLLMQTEGFEDYYQEQTNIRQNSPQFQAYVAAEKDAQNATQSERQSAYKTHDFNQIMKTEEDVAKKIHQIVADEALKKGFDPRIGDTVYWEQHYGKGQPAPTPQPAVKSMPAVVPSQPIVKKAQPVTPSQPAPSVKVQNTAIPSKKTK